MKQVPLCFVLLTRCQKAYKAVFTALTPEVRTCLGGCSGFREGHLECSEVLPAGHYRAWMLVLLGPGLIPKV